MQKSVIESREQEHTLQHSQNGHANGVADAAGRYTAARQERSIFERYYAQDEPFVDRFLANPEEGVDVVIPVMHTNEVWRHNLLSIYREIPVKRLLLGDAGCIDNTLEVARQFPRVTVLDHQQFVSLGFSIRKLIEAVETDWFVYLHSDVYLPPGWFDAMKRYQGEYDWYECPQHLTVLIDFPLTDLPEWRAFSGSQMGRTAALQEVLPRIEDDFLYRNEDIILAKLVEKHGYRYGKVDETFHYHQQMLKKSVWKRKVKVIDFHVERGYEEEVREYMMQAKGIVKYLDPFPEIIPQVVDCVTRLEQMGEMTWREFEKWVKRTNPKWTPFLFGHSVKAKKLAEQKAALKRHLVGICEDTADVGKSIAKLCRSVTTFLFRGIRKLIPLKRLRGSRG